MEELYKYKNVIKRKLKRIDNRIKSYEDDIDQLSKHGYWSLGYFKGAKYELENILDNIEEILNNCK